MNDRIEVALLIWGLTLVVLGGFFRGMVIRDQYPENRKPGDTQLSDATCALGAMLLTLYTILKVVTG